MVLWYWSIRCPGARLAPLGSSSRRFPAHLGRRRLVRFTRRPGPPIGPLNDRSPRRTVVPPWAAGRGHRRVGPLPPRGDERAPGPRRGGGGRGAGRGRRTDAPVVFPPGAAGGRESG